MGRLTTGGKGDEHAQQNQSYCGRADRRSGSETAHLLDAAVAVIGTAVVVGVVVAHISLGDAVDLRGG